MYFDNTYWLLFTLMGCYREERPMHCDHFLFHFASPFRVLIISDSCTTAFWQIPAGTPSSEAGTNFARNVRQFRLRSTTVILLRDLRHAVKFCHVGPTALRPLRRNSCYGYLSPLKIHRPRPDLNPRTSNPIASTITTRPPRPTLAPLPVSYECMSVRLWY
jgi:hypothetical protein